MHKEISAYLSHLYPLLAVRGIEIQQQKEIAYGVQLQVVRNANKATINIYFSEKRGLSKVIGAPKESNLKPELEQLLLGEVVHENSHDMHLWHSWIGSDECGKGDYFGPLIISAFYCTREQLPLLTKLGVCDSKNLKSKQIVEIAKKLYTSFPGQFSALILKPEKYNELISSFNQQNLNLNDLMAWGHERMISDLLIRYPNAEGILVDQFSRSQKVKARLLLKNNKLNVIERPGAERDIAVAAASILSRYQFLEARQAMDRKYQMVLPLGASSAVNKAAREFIGKYGRERLGEIAKLHFKTTDKL